MKKIFFTLLVCLCSMMLVTQAQNNFHLLDSIANIGTALSPNGQNVVGQDQESDAVTYLWEYQLPQFTWLTGATSYTVVFTATAVNDNKVLAGYARNPAVTAELINGLGEPEVVPVLMAGIWQNGAFSPLGLGSLTTDDLIQVNDGTFATCMSTEPWKVGGYGLVITEDYILKYTPMVWEYNQGSQQWSDVNLPLGGYAYGQVLDIDREATIAVGWVREIEEEDEWGGIIEQPQIPYFWVVQSGFGMSINEITGGEYTGKVFKISNNGRYVIFGEEYATTASLYDIENDVLTSIPDFGDYPGNIDIAGVTDDGIVFGYFTYGSPFFNNLSSRGFFFGTEFGLVDFEYYLLNLTENITIPSDISFSSRDAKYYELKDISADGKTVMGTFGHHFLVDTVRTFVVNATKNIEVTLVNEPLNLEAQVSERNTVTLTWEAPEAQDGVTLTGYKIYRNGAEVGTAGANELNYTDTNVDGGVHNYSVSAVYGDIESFRSENAVAIVIDNYNIPFFDGFESDDLIAGFWNEEYTELPLFAQNPFRVQDRMSLVGGSQLNCWYNGTGEPYEYALISKPLDPSTSDDVYISIAIRLYSTTPANETPDTFRIQVSKEEEWITVLELLSSNALTAWSSYILDIKEVVADDLFQVRLLATGESTNEVLWNIDNFRVDNEKNDAPEGVMAFGQDNKNRLVWKNTLDAYEATYLDYRETLGKMAIGNEGKPFIALNAFDGEDLIAFKGMYLTSITLPVDVYFPEDFKFAIQVYIDDELTENQEIQSFTNHVLNTFPLNTPVLIDGKKNIKFGIRVIAHNEADLVTVSYQPTSNPTPFKSDLLSEDDGETWISVSETYGKNTEIELPQNFMLNWEIIGNITETDRAEKTEIDGTLFAYNVYKDGERINDIMIFYYPTFIDENYDENACYQIRSYYLNGRLSELSEVGCFDKNPGGGTSLDDIDAAVIRIYPNPAANFINIEGEFSRAILFDLNGKKVNETVNSQMNVTDVPAGMYIIKIEGSDYASQQKVIIRK